MEIPEFLQKNFSIYDETTHILGCLCKASEEGKSISEAIFAQPEWFCAGF